MAKYLPDFIDGWCFNIASVFVTNLIEFNLSIWGRTSIDSNPSCSQRLDIKTETSNDSRSRLPRHRSSWPRISGINRATIEARRRRSMPARCEPIGPSLFDSTPKTDLPSIQPTLRSKSLDNKENEEDSLMTDSGSEDENNTPLASPKDKTPLKKTSPSVPKRITRATSRVLTTSNISNQGEQRSPDETKDEDRVLIKSRPIIPPNHVLNRCQSNPFPTSFKKIDPTPSSTNLEPLWSSNVRKPTLPIVDLCDNGFPCVSLQTVASLVAETDDASTPKFTIIDCRFPYEYEAGHIRGAVNAYSNHDILNHVMFNVAAQNTLSSDCECEEAPFSELGPLLEQRFLDSKRADRLNVAQYCRGVRVKKFNDSDNLADKPPMDDSSSLLEPETGPAANVERDRDSSEGEDLPSPPKLPPDTPKIVVLHCEFSSQRAPESAFFLRKVDRIFNKNNYPSLCFPEVYVMKGGYSAFFKKYSRYCDPCAYATMFRPDRRSELLWYQHFRKCVNTSCNKFLDTNPSQQSARDRQRHPSRGSPSFLPGLGRTTSHLPFVSSRRPHFSCSPSPPLSDTHSSITDKEDEVRVGSADSLAHYSKLLDMAEIIIQVGRHIETMFKDGPDTPAIDTPHLPALQSASPLPSGGIHPLAFNFEGASDFELSGDEYSSTPAFKRKRVNSASDSTF